VWVKGVGGVPTQGSSLSLIHNVRTELSIDPSTWKEELWGRARTSIERSLHAKGTRRSKKDKAPMNPSNRRPTARGGFSPSCRLLRTPAPWDCDAGNAAASQLTLPGVTQNSVRSMRQIRSRTADSGVGCAGVCFGQIAHVFGRVRQAQEGHTHPHGLASRRRSNEAAGKKKWQQLTPIQPSHTISIQHRQRQGGSVDGGSGRLSIRSQRGCDSNCPVVVVWSLVIGSSSSRITIDFGRSIDRAPHPKRHQAVAHLWCYLGFLCQGPWGPVLRAFGTFTRRRPRSLVSDDRSRSIDDRARTQALCWCSQYMHAWLTSPLHPHPHITGLASLFSSSRAQGGEGGEPAPGHSRQGRD
jgi:hypothetical protein